MEVIELNFCGLNYNLKINIAQRGKKENSDFIEAEDEEIDDNDNEKDAENDNNNNNDNVETNIEMTSL